MIDDAGRCPMEQCTLLVLGSQYGVQILDWNGENLVFDYDFQAEGIAGEEREVVIRSQSGCCHW